MNTCLVSQIYVVYKAVDSATLSILISRYVIRTNKIHTFFINDLIQLYCLRHVSNNQVFILRKTCTRSFVVFFMHPYKQSGRCQDVFDNKQVSLACYCPRTRWKRTVSRTVAKGNLLQKLPAFYGCRSFFVVITKVRPWSLSTAR